ncbi:MAG: hypothetical protein ABUL44_04105, partial [Flavobacterium sp.]
KEIESLKKENEELTQSYKTASENFAALQIRFGESESELLKAKDRFCQCNDNDKTGSTSAMHCNHCGKIEQSETWLR